MALKHGGHGHDPEGIESTSPGSLTVECPACPHPGRNLPDNWAGAGPLMCVCLANHFHCFRGLTILQGSFTFYTYPLMPTSN